MSSDFAFSAVSSVSPLKICWHKMDVLKKHFCHPQRQDSSQECISSFFHQFHSNTLYFWVNTIENSESMGSHLLNYYMWLYPRLESLFIAC